MSTAPPRAWSLGHKLGTIEQAVEGSASVLARIQDAQGDLHAMQAWASQAEGMLALAHRRLHDLGRVLRGELAPALLAAPHNVVAPGAEPLNSGEDVLFPARLDVRASRSARPPHR